MIKNKIIAIITCGALVTAGIVDGTLVSNKNINKKIVQNNILLAAPNLNDLAVVINTNVSPLVLYKSPSFNSNIESYISVGEMLNYEATSNPDFYKVTVQETGASGYISANNLQIIESGLNKASENVNKNGQVINVTTDVKLMSSPDVHSQILGSYKNKTPIIILGKQEQWYKVKINAQIGYMYQEYVGINLNQQKVTYSEVKSIPTTHITNKNIITANDVGKIKYNSNLSSNYSLKTVVVTNTTGKGISSDDLNQFLRDWILKGQFNNDVIPTDMGTQWAGPWLDKVSNNTMMQAFVNANGDKALSENITVNEFVKATEKLDEMTVNNVPFTLPEAKKLITNMLKQDKYVNPNDITKITFVKGAPSVYNVYTKLSGNNLFWTVAANTGNGQA